MERSSPLVTVFYRTASGNEPVREWLRSLTKLERVRIGVDIWKVQSEWPIGMTHVRPLGNGLHEIRSSLLQGIARVIFIMEGDDIVLLRKHKKHHQRLWPWQ